jgi:hypothetical protein
MRLLTAPGGDVYDRDTLTVTMFNYYMEQTHSVRWRHLFYVDSVAEPARAYAKVFKYVSDRMVDPPPLIVRVLGGFRVLERGKAPGDIAACCRRERAEEALGVWCTAVASRRKCTVAVGKTVERILRQIADERVVEVPLAVRLRAVFAQRASRAGGANEGAAS